MNEQEESHTLNSIRKRRKGNGWGGSCVLHTALHSVNILNGYSTPNKQEVDFGMFLPLNALSLFSLSKHSVLR